MTKAGLSNEERFWLKVDKTETCWTWNASIMGTGYGCLRVDNRTTIAHRFSYELAYGPIPDGMQVDHICHVRSCVNPDHLRLVNHKQNGENRQGAASNSKSGIRGVCWDKQRNKWKATVGHNGDRIRIGFYSTIEEAEAAVIAKRLELHTHNDLDRRRAA